MEARLNGNAEAELDALRGRHFIVRPMTEVKSPGWKSEWDLRGPHLLTDAP
ncbi:MAG: hypothetical protein KGI82_03735 [Betaproteobacteria bacterium]|nr:hypothetical protein [Betaproteobacteria bacterium]